MIRIVCSDMCRDAGITAHPGIREERGKYMKKQSCAVCVLCLMFLFSCKGAVIKQLEGKWQAVEPQVNEQEKYLSDEIEFFHNGTVTLSDFPDRKLPFKTKLTKEEKELIKKHYPELEGKNILLILLDPSEHDWLKNAAIYQFTISGNELALRPAIVEKAAKFRRMSPGGHQ